MKAEITDYEQECSYIDSAGNLLLEIKIKLKINPEIDAVDDLKKFLEALI